MADNDPMGYAELVAEVKDNALSGRQQRISIALAMIRDGSSIAKAARTTGIPYSTLHGYHKGITELDSKEADGRAASIEALADESLVAARIATRRVTERLVDPEHEWKDSDLVKAQGVNIDKVIAFQNRWHGPQQTGVAALIDVLTKEHDITLTKRDPATEAIEVKATAGESD